MGKRVHELAFGIVICFGSEEFLYIYATLYIDASLHSPTTLYASASATALPSSPFPSPFVSLSLSLRPPFPLPSSPFAPVDSQAFPAL